MPNLHYYLVAPIAQGGTSVTAFTYHSEHEIAAGTLVQIPFGRKAAQGVVMSKTAKPSFATKAISSTLDGPGLPKHLLALASWLGEYYAAGLGQVWQTILPSGLARKRRAPAAGLPDTGHLEAGPVELTAEQTVAVREVEEGKDQFFLLKGVTGSGKTEVYLELAQRALNRGQSSIILVPEIALTTQILGRFTQRFGESVITYHSALGQSQRHQAWLGALKSRGPKIAVGPRSALFLPVPNLGLIVIDECHEPSYKQEQSPRYHAAAVAGKLAGLTGAKLVLGSATPPITDVFLVRRGRLKQIELTQKFGPTSKVRIVDLKTEPVLKRSQFLSEPLLAALDQTLQAKRQSLLFLNRRGSASSQLCTACGQAVSCPNCHLPITFHADLMRLVCHWCNFNQAPPAVCSNCGASEWRYLGGGTKRIEAEVLEFFPTARVLRWDKDSLETKSLPELYAELYQGKIDILIGTQMVAKGFDLPKLDTVGVVLADMSLNLPDYNAAERTFQLILQAAGRAGRRKQTGQVIVQSYAPDHPAIQLAAASDYDSFCAHELEHRRLLGYPPFRYLMKVTIGRKSDQAAHKAAEKLAQALTQPYVQVLGPAPAFRQYAGGKQHWQLILKSPERKRLVEIANSLPAGWSFDLDPISLL